MSDLHENEQVEEQLFMNDFALILTQRKRQLGNSPLETQPNRTFFKTNQQEISNFAYYINYHLPPLQQ